MGTDDVDGRARRRRGVWLPAAGLVAALIATFAALAVAGSSDGSTAARVITRPVPSSRPLPGLVGLTRHVKCPVRTTVVPTWRLAAFHAVTAVTCREQVRDLPGQGEWLVSSRQVASAGADRLEDAFAAKSAPQTTAGTICAAVGVAPPLVIFVDQAGRTIAPDAPRGICGWPSRGVMTAYADTPWVEVRVTNVRQIVSAAAQAANCAMQWKNENLISSEFGTQRSRGGPVFAARPTALHVCLYRVTARDPEIGNFQRSVDVSGHDAAALYAAVGGAGPTAVCPAQRAFAVIYAADGAFVNVEMGGCWRVHRAEAADHTGTADADTVSALLSRR